MSRDFTPAQVKIPEGITDPDVLAAWERVDYIAKNIWEWGGVPSQRTEELIAQLMPPPDWVFRAHWTQRCRRNYRPTRKPRSE